MSDKYKIEINGKKIELERKKDCVSDYVDKMKSIRDEILYLEGSFSKNEEKIKKLLLELESWTVSTRYAMLDMLKKYPKDNVGYPRENVLKGYDAGLGMGSHGFNSTIINNKFSKKVYYEFYRPWLEEISVFIDSNGLLYPRFISYMHATNNEKGYVIGKAILLTKEDLGYYSSMSDSYIKCPLHKKQLKDLNDTWEFCMSYLPMYYAYCEDYVSISKYKKIWKRVLKSTYLKERFNFFVNSEYKVWMYIKENYEGLKRLKNPSIIEIYRSLS